MKRSTLPVLPVLLAALLIGCAGKDAFSGKRLAFECNLGIVKSAVSIRGHTNLPDGFSIFVLVEPAPQYGVQASWADQADVNAGAFAVRSLFTESLPYRVTFILSPTLNPDYADRFTGKAVPFSFDDPWEVGALAGGQFQLSMQKEFTLGTREDHVRILSPAVGELESALTTLKNEASALERLEGESGGLARFGRLHQEKRHKLDLDAPVTSFYYPDAFEELRKLEKYLEQRYLFVLAQREQDAKEIENQSKSTDRVQKQIERAEKAIRGLSEAVPR